MTDSANFSQLGPEALIEQAAHIFMNRFDLDAPQALGVLRRMSEHNRTQLRAIAEAIIYHNVRDEAEAKTMRINAANG